MTAITNAELRHRLQHSLLVHTDPTGWELAVERSNRDGGGIVFHGRRGLAVAKYLQDKHPGYRRPILVDASAYAGKARKRASDRFDTDWMAQQRKLLIAVLPDAGYIDQDDEAGLLSILTRVHDGPEGTIAPLALHRSWLDSKHGLSTLKQHVLDAGVPIALILEHSRDPLSTRASLRGLVSLLDTGVHSMVLRCDASAVGALCFGANAAAMGTRTGLRHLYPLTDRGGPVQAKVAVLIRSTLSYISLEKLDLAYSKDPDNLLWSCACGVCAGADLSWIGSSYDQQKSAYQHSVEVLYDIRGQLFNKPYTQLQLRQAWIDQCNSAIFKHHEISESIDWDPPPVLGNWASLPLPETTP
jgi:hypothetical protein